MAKTKRNNLEIYDDVAADWWSDDIRWVRTLKNLVPGRLAWFDRHIDWTDKTVLDLGRAGGFMAEALVNKGADKTAEAIAFNFAWQSLRTAQGECSARNACNSTANPDRTFIGVTARLSHSAAR